MLPSGDRNRTFASCRVSIQLQNLQFGLLFLSYRRYRSITELYKYLILIYYYPIIRSIFKNPGRFDAGIMSLPEQ